jgi:single-stranded-DNA-specific exonuclease
MYMENLTPHVRDILTKRGFDTEEKIAEQLYKPFKDVIANRNYLDVDKALDIFKKHKGEEVVVYRDYDCDGISAGAVALIALNSFGFKAYEYANEREVDGYGMCPNGVENIRKLYPNCHLIVTVDNGISSFAGALKAKDLGFDLIITDHHEQGDVLPVADAVIDLKRKDETASFRELCGTGLIFKVMLSLAEELKQDAKPVFDCLDLVALATIADVVPVLNENRTLIVEGTKLIYDKKRPFFKAFLEEMDNPDPYDSATMSFGIAPAVNALSRMNLDTTQAVEAMISNDIKTVLPTVKFMIQNNDERKLLEKTQTQIAENDAEANKSITSTCFCAYGKYS